MNFVVVNLFLNEVLLISLFQIILHMTPGHSLKCPYKFFMLQGFRNACEKGILSGHKVSGVCFVLQDGKCSETRVIKETEEEVVC